MTLLDRICATPWAIRPESLEAIIALADRRDPAPDWVASRMHHVRTNGLDEVVVTTDGEIEPPYFGAVSAAPGTPIEGARLAYRRGSVGVVPVIGPIVRYGSMFGAVSGGATSVGSVALDLNLALADPDVAAVLLHIDSPGGETNGIAELANMIFDARSRKRIVAYVSDLGASAGYWLASAAHEIVACETAALGSIGVVAAVRDPSRADGSEIEFVSQVSPLKRVDPRTKTGKAQIQGLVDTLADVFVRAVARNRDVEPETVASDYGQGGLLVGQDAVTAGLADRLGSFESTLRELASCATSPMPMRSPDRPAAAAASGDPVLVTASADPPSQGEPVDLIDRIRALLDSAPTVASADLEATTVTANLIPPVGQPTLPPTPAPAPQAGPSAENDALRVRLAAAEAENQTLRLRGITEAAARYAEATITGGVALPAEEAAIAALHVRAALDDMYQPVREGPTRVALVEASYAVRQKRTDLISELMEPATLQVLADRARAPKRTAEGDPVSGDREKELLAMTPLGRQQLANGQNGTGGH